MNNFVTIFEMIVDFRTFGIVVKVIVIFTPRMFTKYYLFDGLIFRLTQSDSVEIPLPFLTRHSILVACNSRFCQISGRNCFKHLSTVIIFFQPSTSNSVGLHKRSKIGLFRANLPCDEVLHGIEAL